ncbi:hypothetical protein [Streptomyces sp. NPDC019890]|uniref:hypothetical protein n=1 Tax=Streptomyces sp. NPDC019890 TaxID=3365064 RepID=UPI00384D0116
MLAIALHCPDMEGAGVTEIARSLRDGLALALPQEFPGHHSGPTNSPTPHTTFEYP